MRKALRSQENLGMKLLKLPEIEAEAGTLELAAESPRRIGKVQ